MSANIFRQVSAASTNLTRVKTYGANLKGWVIINTTAAALYVKLWFYLPGSVTAGVDSPAVGTTPPNVTLLIPALGTTTGYNQYNHDVGITGKGDLWMATTVNPGDADATAVGAGALITQLFIE